MGGARHPQKTLNAEQKLKVFKRHVLSLLQVLFPKVSLSQLAAMLDVLEDQSFRVTERTFIDLAFLLTHPEDLPQLNMFSLEEGDDEDKERKS